MNFKNKHSLGQNFLENDEILNNIINAVNISNNDIIVEIGPGMGSLTKKLKAFNQQLYAFELDERTKPYLDKLVDDKTKLIFKDFLNVDLKEYIKNNERVHVIANIPYYITTPIINHILQSNINVVDMTLMVQNEVADRLASSPGCKNYGYITAYLDYYYQIKKLFVVDRKYFNPVPSVDSALIQLTKINRLNKANDENKLNILLKDAFQYKRKNLKNNLSKYNIGIINEILNGYNLDVSCRAEDLS
ncbi:MAG: 16S rRNA (adenine(1518)-N(6)/adenine(1519)-N(6))-dimethyltransferase RsmA, partial [Erysipelotrichaceae bacterium]